MSYKAFEDFYHDEQIRHLVLHKHGDSLVSPPFATEKCKDYSKFLIYKNGVATYIDLELPPATSKFNGICSVGDSIWTIPYGIYDKFNIVLQIKNSVPIYHKLTKPGKGQFYSLDTDGVEAFSFPLGYEDTAFAIHIKDDQVHPVDFPTNGHKKMHMGTTYCNGKFWSPPRGDTLGYTNIVGYDGKELSTIHVNFEHPEITRKYSDFIAKGNTLYALPFGEKGDLQDLLIFNTDTLEYRLHRLNIAGFQKKYNCGVVVNDVIIAVPYGTKEQDNSNQGLVYNCDTGEHFNFDLGNSLGFGGKYRFRSGIEFNGTAVFFPTGTPSVPLIMVARNGQIMFEKLLSDYVVGRPVLHEEKLWTVCYHLTNKTQHLLSFDQHCQVSIIDI